MIGYRALRGMFEGRLQEAQQANQPYGAGRLAALREFHDNLGLETHPRSGMPMIPRDERGLPQLRPNRMPAREVSLRLLADAIHGHELVEELYHPSSGFDFGSRNLVEAAIDPSVFVNINTFNAATAGLVFAEVMERFNHPQYIGRNLVAIKPTKRNGDKLIAVARMGTQTAAAKGRQPGESHAEVGFGEAYQTTPETVEQALKCKVTREAVFFDITDQVLDEAGEGIGDELGRGMEVAIADSVIGVSAGYNRNGTANNTYQTASPWINDHSNPFSDENDIDDARALFLGMTDPESGREIQVIGRTILCSPYREVKFRDQLMQANVQIGTQAASDFPARWKQTQSNITGPFGGPFDIVPLTQIWHNRMTAADGLNLSAANAKDYWWIGDFPKAFEWRENWPLTPWTASADELHMKDHGIVAVFGANYRGVAYPREPRYTVRNKN